MVVAEIGINHVGKLRVAEAMVSLARRFGADFVKFQKRDILDVYKSSALNKTKLTTFGRTKLHQKMGLEFGKSEYDVLDRLCADIPMPWFGSPWDIKSVQFLAQYNPPYIKVASACVTHMDLLEAIKETSIPVIMSCGMSRMKEIDRAVKLFGDQLQYLLHCASEYPTSDSSVNLRGIETLRSKYGKKCKIGFSSHNRRVIYLAAAYAMGAEMLEFHITLDKGFGGDDQMASLGPGEFLKIMEHIDAIERGMGSGIIEPTHLELSKGSQYSWRM
jgi:N-acetylneuraminate synthase